jgi:hypothetical protein
MSQGVSMKRRKIDPETKMAAVSSKGRGLGQWNFFCGANDLQEEKYAKSG